MSRLTRRDFIRNMTAAAACVGLGSAPRVRGANDDIRLAIVGLRKKGKEHLDIFPKVPGVRIVALCDVDTEFLDFEAKKFKDRNEKVATYVDYRKLLDSKDIDAVVIVTPDHWHALMTIWACQAGKDVYIEKPLSHNVWEGRKMVQAARKYERIVQTGSQDRSDVGLRATVEYIKQGNLGKIELVRAISYNLRESIGKVNGPQAIPATVDYDLFQGPAPLVPLMRKNLHYDWHWFWDTGTGEVGNLGAHNIDESRWAIGQQQIAPRAITIAGRVGMDDDGQTPNTQITFFDYEQVPIIYEVRGLRRRKNLPVLGWWSIVRGAILPAEEGAAGRMTATARGSSSSPATAESNIRQTSLTRLEAGRSVTLGPMFLKVTSLLRFATWPTYLIESDAGNLPGRLTKRSQETATWQRRLSVA
jgi:predicted dehydrogenase